MDLFETPREKPGALTQLLAKDGAPWRPFNDEGILVTPTKVSRQAKAIFSACERQLITHLRAVGLWSEKERNQSWRIGDYSVYILSFAPRRETLVYVQFWSEPGEEGMIFEVSSGVRNPPADQYVDTGKQELLRDHGFDIGGNANNFRKIIGVEGTKSLRPIAREAIAILCSVLGYDGTRELRYKLYLGTHATIRHVVDAVSPDSLKKLMLEWHFPADLTRPEGKPPLIESRTDHGPFVVLLVNPSKESSGRFHTIALKAVWRFKVKGKHAFANSVNQRIGSLQASLDADRNLVMEAQIILRDGVTAEHVRGRFETWRTSLAIVAGML
jgi:hypothetical protein